MAKLRRRRFLQTSTASAVALGMGSLALSETLPVASNASGLSLRIAPFRFEVTPPMGHSCCGGWIKPIEAVDDPLEAIGYVLLGAGDPVVVCAVDWTGILNQANF